MNEILNGFYQKRKLNDNKKTRILNQCVCKIITSFESTIEYMRHSSQNICIYSKMFSIIFFFRLMFVIETESKIKIETNLTTIMFSVQ